MWAHQDREILRHSIQIVSGAQPASGSFGTGTIYVGCMELECKLTTHLHLVQKLRKGGGLPALPHTS
jgi:hypothetical protein